MLKQQNVTYTYDGSFEGFLCCVAKSFQNNDMPAEIKTHQEYQPSFFQQEYIETEIQTAKNVYKDFNKLGLQTKYLIQDAYFSNLENKEILIIEFLTLAYQIGEKATNMLAHKKVSPLVKAQRFLINETHLFKGFIRFSDYNGVLVAEIKPKCFVLPKLKTHFCERYPNENFIIFDKTNFFALISNKSNAKICAIESLEFPSPNAQETMFRELWHKYFDTISIAERQNPKCQNSHLPKRYRNDMTEFSLNNTLLSLP